MVEKFGRTLATTSIISYLVAFALEVWRPGFVSYFWNPQILLVLALIGIILVCFGEASKISQPKTIAFFIIFAILGTAVVWFSLPASLTRIMATFSTLLMIIGSIYALRTKLNQ